MELFTESLDSFGQIIQELSENSVSKLKIDKWSKDNHALLKKELSVNHPENLLEVMKSFQKIDIGLTHIQNLDLTKVIKQVQPLCSDVTKQKTSNHERK